MIYPFRCPACGAYIEVVRPAAEASKVEQCVCGQPMNRVYTVPQVTVEHVEGYDYGLGTYISSKAHKRDVLKRINEKTGQNLVEIGNEKLKVAPKRIDYTAPSEAWGKVGG
jgi:hypothetical protein